MVKKRSRKIKPHKVIIVGNLDTDNYTWGLREDNIYYTRKKLSPRKFLITSYVGRKNK